MDDLFHAKVDRSGGLDACWLWIAYRIPQGYGQFGRQQSDGRIKMFRAHRVALEEKLGRPIKPGFCACHRCDNPPCCNPAHLFETTQEYNIKDRDQKGRQRSRTGPANGNARITTRIACEIRAASQEGEFQRSIAKRFGIAQTTVSQIVRGLTWRPLS